MHNLLRTFLLLFLFSNFLQAQLQGHVTDSSGQALQDVSVYIENTSLGTITNANGTFILKDRLPEKGVLIVKYLGYQTQKVAFSGQDQTFELRLVAETIALNEVVLNAKENPADRIIREVQAQRKERLAQSKIYTADFYSKGIVRMVDAPEKFLGQEIGDFEGALDSTRSGILYLSETRSKLFSRGDYFKEIITASKVSGDNQGYSFNSASDAYFNLYEQSLDFDTQLASPIGSAAFSFYRFSLIGTFTTADGQLINQIEVSPKRPTDPTVSGMLYIVEDDWALYGLDLKATSEQTNIAPVEEIRIQQTYNYHPQSSQWVKATQVFSLDFGIFGFKGNVRYSFVYSRYNLQPAFALDTFGPLVQEIQETANQKDSLYWERQRPVALTQEEIRDYVRKDSIAKVRKDPTYLDSIDRKENRLKWGDLLGLSKTLRNSAKNSQWTFTNPLTKWTFNPVQGRATTLAVDYFKENENETQNSRWYLATTYGLGDKQAYPQLTFNRRLNSRQYTTFGFALGKTLQQFDNMPPVSPLINTLANLLYKENPAKWYQNTYLSGRFSSRPIPSIRLDYNLGFEQRKGRTNQSDFSWVHRERPYPINRPDNPLYDFEDHRIFRQQLTLRFYFGVQYSARPDRNFYYQKEGAPQLNWTLIHGFGSDQARYNFLKMAFLLRQSLNMHVYGQSEIALRGGAFITGESPAFSDLTHFHGNETFIAPEATFLNSFNLLPYYHRSTDKPYASLHWEHDFKRWGLGSWPLIRLLKANVMAGAHALVVEGAPFYGEWNLGLSNLGIGKIRGLRVDYIRAWGQVYKQEGIVLGWTLF
ncbi:MAG: DUF5686 and carboxypeptidase regulatory-like domain-containing protein [Flavobacteriaceae bacterium]